MIPSGLEGSPGPLGCTHHRLTLQCPICDPSIRPIDFNHRADEEWRKSGGQLKTALPDEERISLRTAAEIEAERLADKRSPRLKIEWKLSEHIRGRARFSFYRAMNLWYTTDSGLEFPVPIDDSHGATFLAEDKAIFFMRWIRRHIETIKEGTN